MRVQNSRLFSAPRLGSMEKTAIFAPPSIGGVAIGTVGSPGTIYNNKVLTTGDDFTTLSIIRPGYNRGYMPTRAIFDQPGARGADTSTNYYCDPYTTGHLDYNRGNPMGYDNMAITGGTYLKLQARLATAGEKLGFSPTGGGVTGGIRQIAASGINTALNFGWYTGSLYDILVEVKSKITAKANSPRGAHPTFFWGYSGAPFTTGDTDEMDNLEFNSQGGYFIRNVWTAGVAVSTTIGGPVDVCDGTDHIFSTNYSKASTQSKFYLDQSTSALFTDAADPNSKSKPTYAIMTAVSLLGTFQGETFTLADWTTFPNGVITETDWIRVWRDVGAAHYTPLVTMPDVNIDYLGNTVITFPSKLLLWGNGSISEYIQFAGSETNAPGGDALYVQFLSGMSWNAGTRELTITGASLPAGAGRIHVSMTGYDTLGCTFVPCTFVINRGPRVTATSFQMGTSATYDLYALADCGVLVSNSSNVRSKTISVAGLPSGATYNDSTGLVTTSAAPSSSSTPVPTITNSVDQVAAPSLNLLIANLAAETTALLARVTTQANSDIVLINNFILALKTGAISGSNIFAKCDAIYMFAMDTSANALVNWVQSTYNATLTQPTTPVTFTANRGFTTNGSDNYIGTNFNPSTASSPKFTINSASFATRVIDTAQQTNLGSGAFVTATGSTTIQPRSTADLITYRVNQANFDTVAGTFTDASGLVHVNRSGALATQIYKNGSSIGSGVQATAAFVVDTFKFGRATVTGFSVHQFASGLISSSLTANEILDYYNAERAFMTGKGVP